MDLTHLAIRQRGGLVAGEGPGRWSGEVLTCKSDLFGQENCRAERRGEGAQDSDLGRRSDREKAERARQGSGKGAKGGFISQWLLPRFLGGTYSNSLRN